MASNRSGDARFLELSVRGILRGAVHEEGVRSSGLKTEIASLFSKYGVGPEIKNCATGSSRKSCCQQVRVSPAYVQKQMGHRGIQVTIDVCGHLIPGENVEWIDALDRASEKVKATDAKDATANRGRDCNLRK